MFYWNTKISQKAIILLIPVLTVNNDDVAEQENDENSSTENAESLTKGKS